MSELNLMSLDLNIKMLFKKKTMVHLRILNMSKFTKKLTN